MSNTFREISNQYEHWTTTLGVVEKWFEANPRNWHAYDTVYFTGCGTSYYIAVSAAKMFQQVTGIRAVAIPASEIMFNGDSIVVKGDKNLLVGLSRSGTTTETVEAIKRFREQGYGETLSISCTANSPASLAAEFMVDLPHVQENSVVMTSSFTNLLLSTQILSAWISKDDEYLQQLTKLTEFGLSLRDDLNDLADRVGHDQNIQQVIYLGMGQYYGLASESVLKLKEMTQTPTEAYNPLEFRHGPISIVDENTLVVLLTGVQASEEQASVLRDVKNLGGKTLLIGPQSDKPAFVDEMLTLPETLSDSSRSVLYLPFTQLVGYYRALELQLNPDKPRNLTKVVML